MNHQQRVCELLSLSGFNPKVGAENISIPCPLAPYSPLHKGNHDRRPSMGIKVVDGAVLVHCFTCGFKSRQLSYLYSRLAYNDSRWQAALSHAREMESHYVIQGINHLQNSGFMRTTATPEEHLDESLFEPYSGKFAPYLLRRGVTLETGKRWGVGVDVERSRAVIPVRDIQGNLWGAVGRSYINEKPKYLNYWNMKKGKHLLGAQLIEQACSTIVVEGSLDAMITDQAITEADLQSEYNVVSVLGSSVSKEQAKRLISCSHEIILALDADTAGQRGTENSLRLLKKRVMTRVADISQTGKNDFGSCSALEIGKVIESARLV